MVRGCLLALNPASEAFQDDGRHEDQERHRRHRQQELRQPSAPHQIFAAAFPPRPAAQRQDPPAVDEAQNAQELFARAGRCWVCVRWDAR